MGPGLSLLVPTASRGETGRRRLSRDVVETICGGVV